MSWIKKFFCRFFAVIGFAVVALSILLGVLAYYGFHPPEHNLPDKMILSFNLGEGLSESEGGGGLRSFWQSAPLSTREAVDSIYQASFDPHVEAIVMRADESGLGMAQIQELRDAVLFFRESGKAAYIYADTFGFEGGGDSAYYFASAFDEIWMQPSGDWGLFGVVLEIPFIRGLLDKIGVEPIFSGREQYKDATSFLMQKQFNAAEKESLGAIAQDVFEQRLNGIAEERAIDPIQLRTLVNQSPFSSGQALAMDMIDTLGYTSQLRKKILEKHGQDAQFVHLADYAIDSIDPDRSVPVALIYGSGEIMRGHQSARDSFTRDQGIFADDMVSALREAATDSKIKAIVLRIDSPGGSYIASDSIWNAIQDAKKTKPVFAVMGNTAASGGYFIAMAADKIFASPATLTGSIGVLAGKVSVAELAKKLGVQFDKIQIGDNADMWSVTQNFTPAQRKKLEEFLDRSYADFVQKMAYGRNLPLDKAYAAAKGRVWTGNQALPLGLVDGIGGFAEAEADLRQTLGMETDQDFDFQIYPKSKDSLEDLIESFTSLPFAVQNRMGFWQTIAPMFESRNSIQSRMDWILR